MYIYTRRRYNGDHPPTDDAGYDAFMASLPQPYVCDLVRGCTPVTPVMSYLGTQNVRRMYEEVELPERLVVLGDAACSFNPLYGQGITVGVTEAGRLGAMVNERLEKAGGDLDAALAGLSNVSEARADTHAHTDTCTSTRRRKRGHMNTHTRPRSMK